MQLKADKHVVWSPAPGVQGVTYWRPEWLRLQETPRAPADGLRLAVSIHVKPLPVLLSLYAIGHVCPDHLLEDRGLPHISGHRVIPENLTLHEQSGSFR